eukprot:gene15209-20151_t
MTDQATISLGNHDYKVLSGSVGPDVIDIRRLYADSGMFTYDPGFTSTASCESALTYIDGDEGVLLHRGYPIGQLAEQSSFMEVSYLLLNGELQRALEQAGLKTGDGGLQFSLRDQSSGQQNNNGQNNSESGRNAQRLIITEDTVIPAVVAGRGCRPSGRVARRYDVGRCIVERLV